ncbi:MAG: FAD-binding domain-containing protein [Pseudomonadota bacterium]
MGIGPDGTQCWADTAQRPGPLDLAVIGYSSPFMSDATERFPPTRTAAIEALTAFLPHAGRKYAVRRNYDLGRDAHNGVSQLSPYIRARLLTEQEVLQATLARHSLSAAEKFVQEVYWRTYWKGWLEMRPGAWRQYRQSLNRNLDDIQTQAGLRGRWEAACKGETDIDCFNAWAQELTETGYMHNHARMWFASIWIFTLRLPWELGADFFIRHLLDGDPASNTLGWKWVAGLQTLGKHYVARPGNIERYTEGRFAPHVQLAVDPAPLAGTPHPERRLLPSSEFPQSGLRTGLLLHDEDLSPGFVVDQSPDIVSTVAIGGRHKLSPLEIAPHVSEFSDGAIADVLVRFGGRLGKVMPVQSYDDIAGWARDAGLEQIVTPYAPVGPTADLIEDLRSLTGIRIAAVQRPYDAAAWPHATGGFFKFKEKIPKLVAELKGLQAAE